MQKKVTLKQGQIITLHLSDECDTITFYEDDEKLDGEFCFVDFNEDGSSFLLKRMYSPEKYLRQGLGEAVLIFFKKATGNATIWTREIDGIVRTDGSYLTDIGPYFVRKMQVLKLIADWGNGEM
jgi:hypothetical protein